MGFSWGALFSIVHRYAQIALSATHNSVSEPRLGHGSQLLIQPVEGLLDGFVQREIVAGVVHHAPFPVRRGPEPLEKGPRRRLVGEVVVVLAAQLERRGRDAGEEV